MVRPVAPPRVYVQPNGVKVRRMDGGIRYQPPSLKCITTMLLDKIQPHPTPNVHLYQSVQRVVDNLRNLVEDKIMGLETPGTQKFGIQVENYFCSLNKLVNRLTTKKMDMKIHSLSSF